jgi:cohesin loading factor subunit SCC2
MSSRVIQIYLKEILSCFLNGDLNVRVMAMRVIEIILRQGLVHPVQIVPYLICLSTDPETEVSSLDPLDFLETYVDFFAGIAQR